MGFGKKSEGSVVIQAPNFRLVKIQIEGTANYVSNAFAEEAKNMMAEDQKKGSVDKKRGAKKEPKDFQKGYEGSMHRSVDGWHGIPCVAFRAAMVRAASLVGVEMTRAKMCVFVMADGIDSQGQALVKITKGKPERFDAYVRNSNGSADIRARARFAPGWRATVTIRYDADFLSDASVVNLLHRAGLQVGVGAGRPFSEKSTGQGWGTFQLVEEKGAAE